MNIKKEMLALMAVLSLIISGCAPGGSTNPPATLPPMIAPTATQISLPKITLTKGDFYFKVNGKPAFVFSRNMAGFVPNDFAVLLTKANQAGDVFVRVDTGHDGMGMPKGFGYNRNGEIREDWSKNWENFFDVAESKGVYVLPTFGGGVYWNTNPNIKWQYNPFNSANGGFTKNPTDILKKDSPTQLIYLKWFKDVVTRWSKHRNILAWEVFTEINLMNGATESNSLYLAEQLSKIVRENDPLKRPVTSSLADTGNWPKFIQSAAIDYINIHPYPVDGRLDRRILAGVRNLLNIYQKPVLIGESGLSFLSPDDPGGKIIVAQNAPIGIHHAIWAALVSGAINGRALWVEDGFSMYSTYGWAFLEKYMDAEVSAIKFLKDVDYSNFKPLDTQYSASIFGAVIGNEKLVIGWYRDAKCEPPDWKLQPVISKQNVTISIPGTYANWRVDFYNTKTGTDIIQSATISRKGEKITISLPDFKDDLAFKMVPVK